MDYKLIVFTALFLLSILLFAGLPEVDTRPTANGQDPVEAHAHVQGRQTAGLSEEILRLREEQTQLRREIKLLKMKFEAPDDRTQPAGYQGRFCNDTKDADEPSGVTVYLETSSIPSNDPQWTAVSYRDAGTSPGGSKQAVLSIHQMRPANAPVVSSYSPTDADWQ